MSQLTSRRTPRSVQSPVGMNSSADRPIGNDTNLAASTGMASPSLPRCRYSVQERHFTVRSYRV